MTTLPPPAVPCSKDPAHRRLWLADEPHVLHGVDYNTFLQRTLQEADHVDATPFLVGAAQDVAHHQLAKVFVDNDITTVPKRTAFAAEVYRWAGFGAVDFAEVSEKGGTVTAPTSHYSTGWKSNVGVSNRPVDVFTTGWIAGALAAIFDAPAGTYGAVQTRCIAMGASANEFAVDQTPAYETFSPIGRGPVTDHVIRNTGTSPVNDEAVYDAFTSMGIQGDRNGIISTFGVGLTHHYANYYNRICFEFVSKMRDGFGSSGVELAERRLVEAGHVCAFTTLGGIVTSRLWDALVRPNLRTKEDWVYAVNAVVNTLGWGRWEVVEVDDEHATFVVHDDYESVGYLASYGTSERPVSHLVRGAAAGIMNLVYVGNVQSKPVLDRSLHRRSFESGDSFTAATTTSRARGDEVTTIEVSR